MDNWNNGTGTDNGGDANQNSFGEQSTGSMDTPVYGAENVSAEQNNTYASPEGYTPVEPAADSFASQDAGQNSFGTDQNVYSTTPNYDYYQNDATGGGAAPTYYAEDNGVPAVSGTMGLVGMIFGIVSLVFSVCCCGGWLPTVVAIVAIVLCVIALKKGSNPGKAKAGLICAIIAAVLGVVGIILTIVLSNAYGTGGLYESIMDAVELMQ